VKPNINFKMAPRTIGMAIFCCKWQVFFNDSSNGWGFRGSSVLMMWPEATCRCRRRCGRSGTFWSSAWMVFPVGPPRTFQSSKRYPTAWLVARWWTLGWPSCWPRRLRGGASDPSARRTPRVHPPHSQEPCQTWCILAQTHFQAWRTSGRWESQRRQSFPGGQTGWMGMTEPPIYFRTSRRVRSSVRSHGLSFLISWLCSQQEPPCLLAWKNWTLTHLTVSLSDRRTTYFFPAKQTFGFNTVC